MQAFFVSLGLVALAELGDRTQLLALVLATRFRRRAALAAGIAVGAGLNHLIAALVGFYLSHVLDAPWFRTSVAVSFVGMGIWTLVQPDRTDPDGPQASGAGAFLTAAATFFLVEMGDKTQIATAALAARYHSVLAVTLGSTAGLLLTSAPALVLGRSVTKVAPVRVLRIGGALVYLAMGVWSLAEVLGWIG